MSTKATARATRHVAGGVATADEPYSHSQEVQRKVHERLVNAGLVRTVHPPAVKVEPERLEQLRDAVKDVTESRKRSFILGLDISTSVTGVALIDSQTGELEVLDAVKLTGVKYEGSMWKKADRAIEEIVRLVGGRTISAIHVEENAKRFAEGLSSADTVLTLAKFNGIISYLSHKAFGAEVTNINVAAARKAVGFSKKLSPLNGIKGNSVKDMVFDYVTRKHPEFPWRRHVAKTGKSVGMEVFDADMHDACDAWVVAYGGWKAAGLSQTSA